MKRILLFLLIFLGICYGSFSQNFSNGCLITNYTPDRIYISSGGSDYYLTVCNGQSPSNRYASATGRLGAYKSCNDGVYYGYATSYLVAQCPIDDYVPYMLLGVGGLGFLVVRRRFTSV